MGLFKSSKEILVSAFNNNNCTNGFAYCFHTRICSRSIYLFIILVFKLNMINFKKSSLKPLIINFVLLAILLELFLRAFKSIYYDGILWIHTPSVNNVFNKKLGWKSPKSRTFFKKDEIYGNGQITYNSQGFRAPEYIDKNKWDFIVFVIGDSTMQGYQIPDGQFFSHLLEKELKKYTNKPYILPLAVGGYGTIQQYLLVKEISDKIKPDLVIHHWSSNDIANNSYEIEKYTPTANNNRVKPFYEDNEIVYKSPYFFKLSPRIDSLMLMKFINKYSKNFFLEKLTNKDLKKLEEKAWETTDLFIGKISNLFEKEVPKIALIDDYQVSDMYKKHGFTTVYSSVPTNLTGLPRDYHATGAGHSYMIKSIMPEIEKKLEFIKENSN